MVIIIIATISVRAAMTSAEGGHDHHHRGDRDTSQTRIRRQGETSSLNRADNRRELQSDYDPFLAWLQQSDMYGCPPAFVSVQQQPNKKYMKGDKVSSCDITGINCKMYQCNTDIMAVLKLVSSQVFIQTIQSRWYGKSSPHVRWRCCRRRNGVKDLIIKERGIIREFWFRIMAEPLHA